MSGIPPPSLLPGCFCVTHSDSWKSNDLASELPQHRILAQGSCACPSCWVRVFQLFQALLEPWGCSCSPRLIPNAGQGWDVSPARLADPGAECLPGCGWGAAELLLECSAGRIRGSSSWFVPVSEELGWESPAHPPDLAAVRSSRVITTHCNCFCSTADCLPDKITTKLYFLFCFASEIEKL